MRIWTWIRHTQATFVHFYWDNTGVFTQFSHITSLEKNVRLPCFGLLQDQTLTVFEAKATELCWTLLKDSVKPFKLSSKQTSLAVNPIDIIGVWFELVWPSVKLAVILNILYRQEVPLNSEGLNRKKNLQLEFTQIAVYKTLSWQEKHVYLSESMFSPPHPTYLWEISDSLI